MLFLALKLHDIMISGQTWRVTHERDIILQTGTPMGHVDSGRILTTLVHSGLGVVLGYKFQICF
jgi:hypothetical protein